MKQVSGRQKAEDRKQKAFLGILCILLTAYGLLFTGCGTDWEKKLIRKRVKPPRPPQFEVEAVQRPYIELYKQHFNYWKNWHRQLIQDLNRNHKREIEDLQETRRHLISLEKYLHEEKAAEVRKFAELFDRVTARLEQGRLSENDYGILERQLEGLQRQIDSSLRYKKVKDQMLPTPVPVDLKKYQGDEPIIPPVKIKPEPPNADSEKDDSDQLSYEKFRSLPLQ